MATRIRRTDKPHGTETRYAADCRCAACRRAHTLGCRRRRRAIAYGTHVPKSIPNVGARRRVLALMLLGYSMRNLSRRLGMSPDRLAMLFENYDGISPQNHGRVAALYDELWQTPASRATKAERISASRAVAYAGRAGAAPAMAWDDDTIDDPAAVPQFGEQISSWDHQPCGTGAAARRHRRRGEPLDEACRNAERRTRAERRPLAIGAAA